MVSGPFLWPFHTEPIPSFWSEWWAIALGLAAILFGLVFPRNWRQPEPLPITSLLLLPAVLLIALLLQFALGLLLFPQIGLLYAVYLIWAGLLLILGRHLADTVGLARLVDVLAIGFALGSILGAVVALVQWLGIGERLPWLFFPNPGGAIHANIGQPNHHAHYSWLGIVSLFYLRGRERLPRYLLWSLILLIGFGSVLSGSRSVFLYLLILLMVIAWMHHRDSQGPTATLLTDAALLLPVHLALSFLVSWASPRIPEFWAWISRTFPLLDIGSTTIHAGGSVSSAASLYGLATAPSDRLAEMRLAWVTMVEHPWLGVGAGNFTWESFVATASRADDGYFIVVENAHNFLLQIPAEFGVPAGLMVILVLGYWAKQFLAQAWQLEHFWCGTILTIGAAHSLLEYPLWYSYFLGPAALVLGATNRSKVFILTGRRISIYLLLAVAAGALILANLRADYSKIEAVPNYPLMARSDREQTWQASMNRLLKLYHESLLSPWVLVTFTNLAEPSQQMSKDRADLCQRGIQMSPARSLVTRCAMQLAIAGRNIEALQLTKDALRAFPAERQKTIDELQKGTITYPEVAPLWALSQSH